jgi:hypothetical protein
MSARWKSCSLNPTDANPTDAKMANVRTKKRRETRNKQKITRNKQKANIEKLVSLKRKEIQADEGSELLQLSSSPLEENKPYKKPKHLLMVPKLTSLQQPLVIQHESDIKKHQTLEECISSELSIKLPFLDGVNIPENCGDYRIWKTTALTNSPESTWCDCQLVIAKNIPLSNYGSIRCFPNCKITNESYFYMIYIRIHLLKHIINYKSLELLATNHNNIVVHEGGVYVKTTWEYITDLYYLNILCRYVCRRVNTLCLLLTMMLPHIDRW